MANAPVARRYAKALFELALDHDQLEPMGEALRSMSQLFVGNKELRGVLLNPALRLDERRDLLAALAKRGAWPKMFRNFLMLLLDQDRLGHISDISAAYDIALDEHLGRAQARVTAATAMSDAQTAKLKKKLDELTGKDVIITTDVDEDLLGGVIARVGSKIYDGSVQTHLQRMREAILREV